ncbi:MAG: leucine--tRNA ligase [Gammaproteobacteria bacterium]|nr:leucine--tRNA ligase [Gammaproteobacteria bacterium]MCY4219859.1 leucine--tRNA ligase [Gammaproteobacteria bacterium]MCY4275152.1 leucine--tRNA ligase [Gammaproteobacteria bacterium]
MFQEYSPADVESQVQKYWEDEQCFAVIEDLDKVKYYCLSMLPYPSGQLHMGHVRNYTIGDAISRYQRMLGKNVLQPMGWDAFGLPAENAAIANNEPPAKWTYANIGYMKQQLKRMGFAYDWNREFATCTPEYYRWEQWFFTKLYNKGLAYKKMGIVNWDPVENTVLANEQVENGRGWRSGALIERREMPQWFIRITDYAEELLEEIDNLEGWPSAVRNMQRNWIGRSEGIEFGFKIPGEETLMVYTTRPDTIMGITFICVAAEHPLALKAANENPEIARFVDECRTQHVSEENIETMQKKGVPLDLHGIHPVSGEKISIWAANFVLMGYGTGAVMAVPAHDQRDWEFARDHNLEIRPVIRHADGTNHNYDQSAMVEKQNIEVYNSGDFDGLDYQQAFDVIAEFVSSCNIGKRTVKYRIRDWGVSRQRYWGCPIPVVYDDTEDEPATFTVPDEDLPVVLPENVEFSGVQSPIKNDPSFYQTNLPGTDRLGRRETDTFDTFVESSWYYARYCCPDADTCMLDGRANYWLPVDQYVGGIEHAVLHLLYARLFHKLMRDLGLVTSDEPFTRLLCQGMVLKDGKKMSKSLGNTVDPQSMIDQYGADTVRLFILFASPPEQTLEWNDQALAGAHRFLKRWWNLVHGTLSETGTVTEALKDSNWSRQIKDEQAIKLRRTTHQILEKIVRDYEKIHYNTVVAGSMEILNAIERLEVSDHPDRAKVLRESLLILNKVLAPIVPHIAHVLWEKLGESESLLDTCWPKVDSNALKSQHAELVVQVNGKLRSQIRIAANSTQDQIKQAALQDEKAGKFIEGKDVKKIIVVPGRLVNIVAR